MCKELPARRNNHGRQSACIRLFKMHGVFDLCFEVSEKDYSCKGIIIINGRQKPAAEKFRGGLLNVIKLILH